MIPSVSVRLCAVEESLSHVFQTGIATGENSLDYKKGIIEFDQIIVGCTGVHAFCGVMFQHHLNAKLTSGYDPVFAVLIAAVGQ